MKTAQHRVRSRSGARFAAAVLLAYLLQSPAASAALSAVKDCQPCALVFPDGTTLDFSFDLAPAENDARQLRSITVSRDGSVLQSLPVTGMGPLAARASFHFGRLEVPGGHALIGLVLGTGTANSRTRYWYYAGAAASGAAAAGEKVGESTPPFLDLGEFPYLQVDKRSGQLYSRETGGHGGRDYERRAYQIEDGKLLAVREEIQRFEPATGRYRYTVREWRKGRWVSVADRHVDR